MQNENNHAETNSWRSSCLLVLIFRCSRPSYPLECLTWKYSAQMIEAESETSLIKDPSAATNDRCQSVGLLDLATEDPRQLRIDPPQSLSNILHFIFTITSDFVDMQNDTSAGQITAQGLSKISQGRTSVNDVGAKVLESRPRPRRDIEQPELLELQARPYQSTWNQQNLQSDGFSLIPLQLQQLARHCHGCILSDRIDIIHALRNRRAFLKQIKRNPRHEVSRHIRKVLSRDHGRISRQLENLERRAYRRLLFTVFQYIGKSNTMRRLIDRLARSRIGAFAFRRRSE